MIKWHRMSVIVRANLVGEYLTYCGLTKHEMAWQAAWQVGRL